MDSRYDRRYAQIDLAYAFHGKEEIKMEAKKVVYCSCGNPQSYPIPHDHDLTDRERLIKDASFKAGSDQGWSDNKPYLLDANEPWDREQTVFEDGKKAGIKEVVDRIEQALSGYGTDVLSLNRKYPIGKDDVSRFNAFNTAREKRLKEICQLFEPDEKVCPECHGEGKHYYASTSGGACEDTCITCNGTGKVPNESRLLDIDLACRLFTNNNLSTAGSLRKVIKAQDAQTYSIDQAHEQAEKERIKKDLERISLLGNTGGKIVILSVDWQEFWKEKLGK